jgi:hypothetical protein
VDYLEQLLQGALAFPDRAEHNDRWPLGVQLFIAATLAQLKPNHPFVDDAWQLWLEITRRTFSHGQYDSKAEIEAHRELTGATIRDSYLVLNNQYTIILLSARPNDIPIKLQEQLFDWLWQHPDGLRYLGVPVSKTPCPNPHPTVIDRWFTTQEFLARFPLWRDWTGDLRSWFWDQQNTHGFWDFGARAQSSHYLPLSANWRKSQNRKIDWSMRVLNLLAQAE